MPSILLRPDGGRLLMFLPLAHVFARYLIMAMLLGDIQTTVISDIKTLLKDLKHVKPTVVLGVPRVFEKIYNAASQKAGKGIKGLIFKNATKVAIQYGKTEENIRSDQSGNQKLGTLLTLQKALYNALVYRAIRNVLGGKLENCISGGAALNNQTNYFFHGVGLNILEGYGLTETCAPVAVNRVDRNKVGSVGQPLPKMSIKTAKDGEILIKGPSVFSGYFADETATKEAFTKDGYFKTGDLGRIDSEQFLYITGRKKNIIVTAGGKNVNPETLEKYLDKEAIIETSIVIGDKKPFISALITLSKDDLKAWLKDNNLPKDMSIKDAATNKAVHAHIKRAVADANRHVSRAESIRKFYILPKQFSEKDKTLTPSAKVARPEVLKKYKDVIENEIY
jgi:long-chain acyl-CoA synthetase